MPTTTIEEAIAALAAGRMIILADDEQRENEGDFVMIAQLATADAITFMAEQARTIITLTLTGERCERLQLPLMKRDDHNSQDTAFTVTIEAVEGVTTGSSATDRLRTVKAAIANDAKPEDLVRPGHVFPLRAAPGGVLNRAGHTEAACDLARLAGFEPAGLISEIQLADGTMARMPDLEKIAAEQNLLVITIAALIEHRCQTESLIEKDKETTWLTAWGEFVACHYRDTVTGGHHIALVKGNLDATPPLVRVMVSPDFQAVLGLAATSCSWTAAASLARIREADCGVLLALHVDAPTTPGEREQPRQASMQVRNYGIGAQILRDLGVTDMRLLSAPLQLPSMQGFGLNVVEFIAPEEQNNG